MENEDGSPFTDPKSRKKYPRARVQNVLDDQMMLKCVDESGQVIEGRYNDIHIQPAQYSSLKIVVLWNSRNLRRRRNEVRAANARRAAEELERQRALLSTFHQGQVVIYSMNDYDNYMGQQGALLGTYRFPATILEIIPGSPPRAQIRYDAADSQPPAPGWVAHGVVTKTVILDELVVGTLPSAPAPARVAAAPARVAAAPARVAAAPARVAAAPAPAPASRNANEDPAPPSPGGGTRKSKRSKRKTRRRRAI